MRILLFLAPLLVLGGCTAGSEAVASESDEQKFKNPQPMDPSKIPSNAFDRPGPRFVGEPTGASNPSGNGSPPPGVTGKG